MFEFEATLRLQASRIAPYETNSHLWLVYVPYSLCLYHTRKVNRLTYTSTL